MLFVGSLQAHWKAQYQAKYLLTSGMIHLQVLLDTMVQV